MPIFNVSSLGVGSLTNLCFHSQISANELPSSSCSFSNVSYNYIPCIINNNLLNFNRKSGINRYPVYAAQINASSDAKVDEDMDESSLSPESEPTRPIRVSFISTSFFKFLDFLAFVG